MAAEPAPGAAEAAHADEKHGDAKAADAGHGDEPHAADGHAAVAAGDHGAADHGHGGHHGHVGTEGVSVAPEEFKTDLAIWSAGIFLVLLAGLSRFAWGPIAAGLEKREAAVLQVLADAETARLRAEKMLAQHEEKLALVQDEVRAILAEARRDADHTRNQIVATAQSEADLLRKRSVEDIGRAKDAAMDELFAFMTQAVSFASEQVVGRSLKGEDHDRLVNESLVQFTNSRKA